MRRRFSTCSSAHWTRRSSACRYARRPADASPSLSLRPDEERRDGGLPGGGQLLGAEGAPFPRHDTRLSVECGAGAPPGAGARACRARGCVFARVQVRVCVCEGRLLKGGGGAQVRSEISVQELKKELASATSIAVESQRLMS
jgi:hypothetical protein